MTAISIIHNPVAGRRKGEKKLRQLREIISRSGVDVNWLATERAGHAGELAAQCRTAGVDLVIAAGGDGTVSEVAGALVDAEGRGPELLVWPMGSGNDFVANTDSASHPKDWEQAFLHGRTRLIDAGRVDVVAPGSSSHYFFNNAGFGLEADVIAESNRIRRIRGLALYVVAALRAMRGAMLHEVVVTLEGQRAQAQKLTMVSIANGARSGGGFRLLPPAELDDGRLDVGLVRMPHRRTLLRLMGLMFLHKHLNSQWIEYGQTRRLEVEFPNGLSAHVDGELFPDPVHKVKISIVPQSLRVRIPADG